MWHLTGSVFQTYPSYKKIEITSLCSFYSFLTVINIILKLSDHSERIKSGCSGPEVIYIANLHEMVFVCFKSSFLNRSSSNIAFYQILVNGITEWQPIPNVMKWPKAVAEPNLLDEKVLSLRRKNANVNHASSLTHTAILSTGISGVDKVILERE